MALLEFVEENEFTYLSIQEPTAQLPSNIQHNIQTHLHPLQHPTTMISTQQSLNTKRSHHIQWQKIDVYAGYGIN